MSPRTPEDWRRWGRRMARQEPVHAEDCRCSRCLLAAIERIVEDLPDPDEAS